MRSSVNGLPTSDNVSFATIGAIWLSHNSITHYLHSASTTFSD